ncbi:MAG: zinc ribbon domain-containing protein [Clostridiales bacterium]|nr:zinc ribbon domain-containing protein [Clostridiales bacterium]
MGFFENVGKTFNSLWSRITLPVQNKLETKKLDKQIAAKEKDLNAIYTAIGRSYYANHAQDPQAEEQDKFQSIQAVGEELRVTSESKEWLAKVNKCQNCGAVMHLDVVNCVACGAPMFGEGEVPQDVTCPYCGQVSADPNVCSNCGISLAGVRSSAVSPAVQQQAEKNKKTGIVAFFSSIAVLVLLVVALFGGLGNSPKSVAMKYFRESVNANMLGTAKCLPPQYIKYMLEEEDMTRSEFNQELKDMSKQIKSSDIWEEMKSMKITFKVTDVEDIDRDDFREMREDYKDEYGFKITDAKTVRVEMKIKSKEYGSHEEETTIDVVKVGGKWYVDPESFDPESLY